MVTLPKGAINQTKFLYSHTGNIGRAFATGTQRIGYGIQFVAVFWIVCQTVVVHSEIP